MQSFSLNSCPIYINLILFILIYHLKIYRRNIAVRLYLFLINKFLCIWTACSMATSKCQMRCQIKVRERTAGGILALPMPYMGNWFAWPHFYLWHWQHGCYYINFGCTCYQIFYFFVNWIECLFDIEYKYVLLISKI